MRVSYRADRVAFSSEWKVFGSDGSKVGVPNHAAALLLVDFLTKLQDRRVAARDRRERRDGEGYYYRAGLTRRLRSQPIRDYPVADRRSSHGRRLSNGIVDRRIG